MEIKKEDKNNSLIIDSMMKIHNYFPKITEFESLNKEIPDKTNFSKIFPNFLSKLKEFDKFYSSKVSMNRHNDYEAESYLSNYLKNNDSEVKAFIKDLWEEQLESNINHICFFIILVDKFVKMSGKISEYDTNILFWTILFHDLGKYIQMNPFLDEKIDLSGYDKTHPFKGVIIFLNSAFEHDLFYYSNDEYKNELINMYKNEFTNLIFKSWNFENLEYYRRYNICFKYIDEIQKFFMKIKSEEKNEWIYDICILITFHQSLPNNEYNMNSPLLEEKYIKIFFDKRLAEMMRIIMIYDSSSHSMFFGSNWPELINKNMDKVMKLFE